MSDTITSLSKEYVKFPILKPTSDPTAFPVQMAIVLEGTEPVVGDWFAAEWFTDATGLIWIRGIVGPGSSKQLTDGIYEVYGKWTGNPEAPVKKAKGKLTVT